MIFRHCVLDKIRATAPYCNLLIDLDANRRNDQCQMQIHAANTATHWKNKYHRGGEGFYFFFFVVSIFFLLTHASDLMKFNKITYVKILYIYMYKIHHIYVYIYICTAICGYTVELQAIVIVDKISIRRPLYF